MTGQARPRLAWVEPFLAALRSGATYGQALGTAGVSDSTVRWYRSTRPEFAAEVEASRPRLRALAATAGPRTFTGEKADRLLAALRGGMTLKGACVQAGVPVATVKRARRVDAEFDEAVVAAAAAAGTVLSRCPQLACPGERCGTPTGYDYGCSRDACRAAAAARVSRRRRA